ncbi:hypothetical protein CBR_g16810 [Chara braunii]|uniref:Myb-like domain-containing protein n=1 Tax=Chara braunii TaxID=69332 RepID=A0A388KTV1_CHABU|nr:hypothetical protein CBR_g16810 [Chara braunii]|eukprot:GBG73469.1 hypothetical protein CBR_g16810 [Chara braunii]
MSTPTVTVSGPVASPRCTPRCNLGLGFSRGGKPANGRQMRIFEAAQRVHKTTASVCRQARVAVCRASQLRCRPCSLPSSAVAVVRCMDDIFRKLPLLLLAVFLLVVVVVLHVCFVGNAPWRRHRQTSPMKAVRTDSGQGSPRGGGEQVVSRRAVGSSSLASRLSLGVGNSSLPPHLQPLPDSSDEEEREGRTRTLPLGSGSTQEWSWTELCGGSGGVHGQSFTELLAPGLDGEEGHGGSNLSSGLSTGRRAAVAGTSDFHLQEHVRSSVVYAVPGSGVCCVQPGTSTWHCRGGGGYLDDVVDDRDGRLVWAEERRKIREGREEAIRRGVERLRMDRQAEEVEKPHAGLPSEDDDDDDAGEAGDGNDGYASPSQNSDRGGKGGKTKATSGNGRGRPKKARAKANDGEGDGDAEEKRNFWSVEHIIALIRAKRDQDAHLQGMGHAYTWMKPREWKWNDLPRKLKNVGVDRKPEKCGKKWDNLMQQFKKVHHFQSSSGGIDFFQLNGKKRARPASISTWTAPFTTRLKGPAVSTKPSTPKTLPKLVPAAVCVSHRRQLLILKQLVMPTPVRGGEDENEGSTRGSSQTPSSPHGFGKRKSTRQ